MCVCCRRFQPVIIIMPDLFLLFFDDIVYMCVMGAAAFVFTQAGIAPFIYFLIVIYIVSRVEI
jgi:hypothetical protein